MTDIADLARRFSRKLEIGKGMQLDPDDLALLCAIGVNDVIQTAAADFLRDQCQQRVARNRSINGESSSSTQDQAEPSKSFGMTSEESASDAVARARRTRDRGGLRSITSTSRNMAASRSAPNAGVHVISEARG